MRLTWRDAVATIMTAAVGAIYIAFLAGAYLPLLSGPRALAAAVFVVGMTTCIIGSADIGSQPTGWSSVAGVLGLTALIAAIATVITGGTFGLTVLVAAIVGLWALTTIHHASRKPEPEAPTPPDSDELLEEFKDTLPPRMNVY